MDIEREFDEEEVIVLRKNNRIKSKVNRQLRRAIKNMQDHTDDIFLELCEHDKEAEKALETLWAFGNFTCGPKDYETIIEESLAALNANKTQAIDQSKEASC